jgi:DNA-binding transcriptional LysR family regulator
MDRLAEMQIFVATVEQSGFSSAARALDMTPSAVSKQIRRLEDRLGVQLFNRTTRRISLTEAGRRYYQHCDRILAEVAAAEEEVSALQQGVRGQLRISVTAAFARVVVVPRLRALLERYPELGLEIELTDRPVDLLAEGLDAAIRLSEQVEDPSLVARRLALNERIICASPEYLDRHGVPHSPEQLRHHNCLTLYSVSRFNDWEFRDASGSRVVHVDGNFHANTADALYQATLAGIGLARLSTWLVADDIRAGRLCKVLPDYTHASSAYYVLYPQGRHQSPKLRAFIDFLVELFTPVPPWERESA